MRFVHTRLSKACTLLPTNKCLQMIQTGNRTICHKVNKSGLGQTSSFNVGFPL
uniref:Uncharacterized protein n=1 Tax=Anguilla anguilla TaxID=7936 RepID=A0A0E9PHM0_ANGAN